MEAPLLVVEDWEPQDLFVAAGPQVNPITYSNLTAWSVKKIKVERARWGRAEPDKELGCHFILCACGERRTEEEGGMCRTHESMCESCLPRGGPRGAWTNVPAGVVGAGVKEGTSVGREGRLCTLLMSEMSRPSRGV